LPEVIRVRHYTKKSSKIEAKDHNKVFVEQADHDPYNPRVAEARYGLKYGKGNPYIEFDVVEDELQEQKNRLSGKSEFFLRGDVDLANRNPEGFDNR
jgi:hypothetical protein